MKPHRFDDFIRQLESRLSRRTLFLGTTAIAAAASPALTTGISSQNVAIGASDRFTFVRRYDFSGNVDEARAALLGLVAVMELQAGFVSYSLVDAGENGMLAISTFLDMGTAESATEAESAWISENTPDLLAGQAEVLGGDVILRSSLPAGCSCQTGTHNPCNSDQLICCQTTDRLDGPGICLTSKTACPPVEVTTPADTACMGDGCECATGTQDPCDAGFVCCSGDPDNPPGGPGTCRAEAQCGCSEQGCHCVGGVQNACDQGLTCCQGEATKPGGAGICQETC